jgi:hypothetical protein
MYRGLAFAQIILFLTSVARFYHRGTGFTSLIGCRQGQRGPHVSGHGASPAICTCCPP